MKNNIDNNFFLDETRCGYAISAEMKQVWAIELDLLEKLKAVCEKHDLKYYLAGGSLIGAIRHKGFIPWDDDVDLFMPRDDFEKLKKLAPYEFEEPYFFQTEESDPDVFLGGFARLRNSNTTHIEHLHASHTANFGIWIDISILDYLYEDENKRNKQIRKIRHYQRMLHAKTYSEYEKLLEISVLHWKLIKIAARSYSRARICELLHRALTCCQDSRYVTSFSYHNYRYSPPLPFEKKDFRESIPSDFEWLKLPVPVGYDNILKLQYGSYSKLPPKEHRVPHHIGIVDALLPYKNYLLKFDWFLEGLEDKRIVIFGAGNMLEHYLNHEGKGYLPEFIVDNNSSKWGTQVQGIHVRPPQSVLTVPRDDLRLLICSIHYREIAQQLRTMGIDRFYIYVQEKEWL